VVRILDQRIIKNDILNIECGCRWNGLFHLFTRKVGNLRNRGFRLTTLFLKRSSNEWGLQVQGSFLPCGHGGQRGPGGRYGGREGVLVAGGRLPRLGI
jgi:hypothetical protein